MKTYKIEVESQNDYDRKEEFNMILKMDSLDFISLFKLVLDFVADKTNNASIVLPESKIKVIEADRPD